jgi:adenosylmethionine-8-amino-7-oxononanoate aminotransferase
VQQLLARDFASLLHPQHDPAVHRSGRVWVRGRGAMLVDADGHEYIDGLSSLWNVVLGHGRRELVEAACEQMETLAYASGYSGSSNVQAIELAERLAHLTYPDINRFFFTSGGAEANETAIKIARSYWKRRGRPGKTTVISRELGYHGTTLATMSATGIAGYWPQFEPRVPGFVHVPALSPEALEEAIVREGADTVAMFLAEPVMGVGGVIPPPDDYFRRVRDICTRYEVLFAADEVITGFGRTGEWFALDHWGVAPDLVQFAKAITSGYFPFGGVGVTDAIARVLDEGPGPWMHAYTYSAHPTGCAVALRTLQIIEEEHLVADAARKGTYLLTTLRERLGDHPHVGDVRGKGLMCAVDFVKDRDGKTPFATDEQAGARIHAQAVARGLFSRFRGDTFVLAPPFVIEDDLLDRIADILADATKAVLA